MAKFGPRVDAWIHGMKNDGDDKDRAAYLARIAAGPEEVRLIKLADLTENMASCAYAIPDMGLDWTRSFFLPIATETSSMLRQATFTAYPRTAGRLRGQMDFQLGHLQRNIAMFLSSKPSVVDEVFARVDAANAAALAKAEAEAHASGKEPFSLSRLEEIYEPNLKDREASLRMRYYVRHPELRTLAELVQHLLEHEVWG